MRTGIVRSSVVRMIVVAIVAAAFAGQGAHAEDPAGTGIVAGPASKSTNYATTVMVVRRGGKLTFVNGDAEFHNVVTTAYGPGTQPWCTIYTPVTCPLLYSDWIGPGIADVLGTENLVPGQQYEFYCEPHSASMRGTLIVPSP
jgi:plastocyanin